MEPTGIPYEVFLNFRGTDTRFNLVDVLRGKLKVARIRHFYDDKSLRVGDELGQELMRAIENSQIYIVILSKRYASSKWCLRELSFMLECRRNSKECKVILPLLYDVEVNDVKLLTETFNADFKKHEPKYENEVAKWRAALTEVTKLKILEYKNTGLDAFGDLVVKAVELKLETRCLSYPLVGMKDKEEKVMKLLDIESCDVRFLVIYGDSGTGKTTLAKLIYNQISVHFEGSSFVADIKESSLGWTRESSSRDLVEKRLLRDIPGDDQSVKLKERFRNKKVLIVLDDVDQKGLIKKLIKSFRFGRGSRIIITAMEEIGRDIQKKIPEQSKDVFLYKMEKMSYDDALQHLIRCSFGEDEVKKDRMRLARRTLESLGSHALLPLTIEVIGSFLYGRGDDVWERTIKKLADKKISGYHIVGKLRIIYDELDEKAKQIFLDIACFFVDMEKPYALYMWRDCGVDSGIKMLKRMLLVKVVDNKFWMHEILRQLGREIVGLSGDPGKRSRVWIHDEAWAVLQRDKDKKEVEGLRLSNEDSLKDQTLGPRKFTDLAKLRFLRLYYTSFSGDLKDLLPRLRWLSWHHCPSNLTANDISLRSLVVLELSECYISDGWRGWSQLQEANNLEVLDIRNCQELTSISNLSKYKHLERLVLQDCRKLIGIDVSICEVKCLKFLTIEGCDSLETLPEEIGKLEALEEVVITKGKCLSFKLPKSIGQMKSLSVLVVDNVDFSEFPEFPDVGGLEKLERLSLSRCVGIKQLPDSFGDLKSLVELDISDTTFPSLPSSIEKLKELKVIKMERSSITEFPKIGRLEKLEEIHAKGSEKLSGGIKEIENLLNLSILDLSFTGLIGPLEKMSRLSLLQKLHLDGCSSLHGLKELPEKLTSLHASFQLLHKVKTLTKLNNVADLVIFDTGSDGGPQQSSDVFGWIGKLQELEHLELAIPPSLESWQDKFLASSSKLKFLKLSCREKLPLENKLPSSLLSISFLNFKVNFSLFKTAKELTFLELDNCIILWDEKVEIGSQSLVHFYAQNCLFVKAKFLLPTYLMFLHLSQCKFRSRDAELKLSELKKLKELKITSCDGLIVVQGIDKNLEQLQKIVVEGCNSLKSLEGDVSKLDNLRFLQLSDCGNLKEVKGLSGLKEDITFKIIRCHHQLESNRKKRPPNPYLFPEQILQKVPWGLSFCSTTFPVTCWIMGSAFFLLHAVAFVVYYQLLSGLR